MKNVLLIILTISLVSISQLVRSQSDTIFCKTYKCIENNIGRNITIQGILLKEPYKGWEWRLLLSDKLTILVDDEFDERVLCSLVGKEVLIKGWILYQSIWMDDCLVKGIVLNINEMELLAKTNERN